MKIRMLVAALAATCLLAAGSLRAADEAKPALKCPVSGQPAKAEHKVAFNGGEVEFCCPNCPKAFEANKEKFAAKANLQLAQTKQLKQIKCPLTGRPVAADKVVKVEGVDVGLCCGGCLAKANKATGDDLIVLLFKDTTKGFEPAKK
jgi:YHS domain-containing protein